MERRVTSHTEEEEMNQRRYLLNLARNGDEKAIDKLFELYQVKIYTGDSMKIWKQPIPLVFPSKSKKGKTSPSKPLQPKPLTTAQKKKKALLPTKATVLKATSRTSKTLKATPLKPKPKNVKPLKSKLQKSKTQKASLGKSKAQKAIPLSLKPLKSKSVKAKQSKTQSFASQSSPRKKKTAPASSRAQRQKKLTKALVSSGKKIQRSAKPVVKKSFSKKRSKPISKRR